MSRRSASNMPNSSSWIVIAGKYRLTTGMPVAQASMLASAVPLPALRSSEMTFVSRMNI
jgi:hypothetical protein